MELIIAVATLCGMMQTPYAGLDCQKYYLRCVDDKVLTKVFVQSEILSFEQKETLALKLCVKQAVIGLDIKE